MKAAVMGRQVDRVPYIAWHHFSLNPAAGPDSTMAQAELDFYGSFQPDLLKVMHDIPFEQIDAIVDPESWRTLPILEPDKGNFAQQLFTLREVRKNLDPSVPMIDTVFGVYSYANDLCGKRLAEHVRTNPKAVRAGAVALAQTLKQYAKATLDAGCEGIYYALSGASDEGVSREEYATIFADLDREVLSSVSDAPFNILHLHGYKNLYFDMVHDLPAAAVCWSDIAGGPSYAEARRIHPGCLMCGIDETRFEQMTPSEIESQGRAAISEAGTSNFILAPGCSVPNYSRIDRLQAIRAAVS
jgi:uroporphyrinogen decarboxylase